MDLKGTLYEGRIYPGPTALVLASAHSSSVAGEQPPYFKVEGITDEFCCLTKIGDAMAKMNAVDEFGEIVDSSYYHDEEDDVNRTNKPLGNGDGVGTAPDVAKPSPGNKKRKRGSKSNATAVKKKAAPTKKK